MMKQWIDAGGTMFLAAILFGYAIGIAGARRRDGIAGKSG